jgi:hypothetical protein
MLSSPCYAIGVVWGYSTPGYSQSNGHAEAAVAAMKDLVAKIAPTGDVTSEAFAQGMLEFRNTLRENGLYPAEMVFGHQLRSIVPAHRSSFATQWQKVMEATDRQAELDAVIKFRYDENAWPFVPLSVGTAVRVRDPKSKLWDKVGVIVAIGRYRSYRIKFASGSVLWRNRRFIRPMSAIPDSGATPSGGASGDGDHESSCSLTGVNDSPTPSDAPTVLAASDQHSRPPVRRGTRARRKKVHFECDGF